MVSRFPRIWDVNNGKKRVVNAYINRQSIKTSNIKINLALQCHTVYHTYDYIVSKYVANYIFLVPKRIKVKEISL